MENKITPIKPTLLKKVMQYLFLRQFMYIVIMRDLKCNRKEAKFIYKIWKEFKR
jgi:hypothetical protein